MTAVLERVNTEALEQEGDTIMLELFLHNMAADAKLIREAAGTNRFGPLLQKNLIIVEEIFDQMRAAMEVLNGN